MRRKTDITAVRNGNELSDLGFLNQTVSADKRVFIQKASIKPGVIFDCRVFADATAENGCRKRTTARKQRTDFIFHDVKIRFQSHFSLPFSNNSRQIFILLYHIKNRKSILYFIVFHRLSIKSANRFAKKTPKNTKKCLFLLPVLREIGFWRADVGVSEYKKQHAEACCFYSSFCFSFNVLQLEINNLLVLPQRFRCFLNSSTVILFA